MDRAIWRERWHKVKVAGPEGFLELLRVFGLWKRGRKVWSEGGWGFGRGAHVGAGVSPNSSYPTVPTIIIQTRRRWTSV